MFVKICGITRVEDADVAVAHGASAIGFIFWSNSPRYVDPDTARTIARRLPPFVTPVGVFVNETVEQMNALSSFVGLGAVQLHGDEQPDVIGRVHRPVVKAIGRPDDEGVSQWPEQVMLLVDADDRERRGGTGTRADWSAAALLARTRRIILAGGLSAANVAEAITTVRPFALDVSSGVEVSPGIKDPGRIRDLFEALRQVDSARNVTRESVRAR